MMVTILFDCKECLMMRAKAFVRDRKKDEPLKAWMDEVNTAVAMSHRLLAPYCTSRKVDLRIPAPEGSDKVGVPPKAK